MIPDSTPNVTPSRAPRPRQPGPHASVDRPYEPVVALLALPPDRLEREHRLQYPFTFPLFELEIVSVIASTSSKATAPPRRQTHLRAQELLGTRSPCTASRRSGGTPRLDRAQHLRHQSEEPHIRGPIARGPVPVGFRLLRLREHIEPQPNVVAVRERAKAPRRQL